jgi:hypothetical protein
MDIRNRLLKLSLRVGMVAGILTLLSANAFAHDPGLSAVEVRVLGDRIVAEVSFSPLDLENIQQVDSNLLSVEDDRGKLELRSFSRKSLDENRVRFVLEFSSSNAAELRISAPVVASLPRGHKQFCSVYDNENRVLAERMLNAESNELRVDLQTNYTSGGSIFRFLLLGVEHILFPKIARPC